MDEIEFVPWGSAERRKARAKEPISKSYGGSLNSSGSGEAGSQIRRSNRPFIEREAHMVVSDWCRIEMQFCSKPAMQLFRGRQKLVGPPAMPRVLLALFPDLGFLEDCTITTWP